MITTLAPKQNSLKKTHCIPQTKKLEIWLSLNEQGGVSHCGGLAIYIKKYLEAKEELWKLKYFNVQKI
jgi:hypothetical protein